MKTLLSCGLLALMGVSASAHAIGPRFSNYPSSTVVSVSKKTPGPNETISVSATVRAQALGVTSGRPVAGEDIGGSVEFFANGASIGKVRIGRANAPTVGSVKDLDNACWVALRDPVACTYYFYYGREITLSVPYQVSAQSGAVSFTASYSGDSNFSQGSTSGALRLEPLSPPLVYAVKRLTSPVELATLTPQSGYQAFKGQVATAHSAVGTSQQFQFQMADLDGDGIEDLFFFNRSQTGSGATEVHVLKGPEYTGFIEHAATALGDTGSDNQWKFLVGDYDRDSELDIYVIKKYGTTGKLEVHVLDGKTGFKTFLAQHATIQAGPGNSTEFDFGLGDYNADGILDLYAISKVGASGKTEVHVLNGASGFQDYLANIATGLATTGSGGNWVFGVGDYNSDGKPDVYAFRKQSAHAEVHVLDGANGFNTSLLQIVTPVDSGGNPDGFDMLVGKNVPLR